MAGQGASRYPATLLLRFTLVGDGSGFRCDLVGITQIVALERFEVFVELIHQRHAGRDVQFEDFVFAQVVEVFHQRAGSYRAPR